MADVSRAATRSVGSNLMDNPVKRALMAGEVQIGSWIREIGSPDLGAVMASAGLDYLNIDMEHSQLSLATVAGICQRVIMSGGVPIVRPPRHYEAFASRLLDVGALGLLVPHVDSGADAQRVVRATRFPPIGNRGSSPPGFFTSYRAIDRMQFMAQSNREILLLVQIESQEALDNIDEILGVAGIDGVTVGRNDLAADLGVADVNGERIDVAVEKVIEACLRHHKIPGLMVGQEAEGVAWAGRGIRYLTLSNEVQLVQRVLGEALAALRSGLERPGD